MTPPQRSFTDVSYSSPIRPATFCSPYLRHHLIFASGLNRAIPDGDLDSFVDTFAHRVASWDHQGIADAKRIINAQSTFPTVAEWAPGYAAFKANGQRAVVQERVAALQKAGLQTDVEFEKDFTEIILDYSGLPPWNI